MNITFHALDCDGVGCAHWSHAIVNPTDVERSAFTIEEARDEPSPARPYTSRRGVGVHPLNARDEATERTDHDVRPLWIIGRYLYVCQTCKRYLARTPENDSLPLVNWTHGSAVTDPGILYAIG
jgi:hypothetical protein